VLRQCGYVDRRKRGVYHSVKREHYETLITVHG
jgi:hypothetical protein